MLSGTTGCKQLQMEIHADAAAASRRAAAWIADAATRTIAEHGRFVMALSGGNTPQPMLQLLAAARIDWRHVHVVQVDERVAPAGSPDRSLTQLQEALLARVHIPATQVHPMPVDDANLAAAAGRYGRLLGELAGLPPQLDLVQLGLGADGHTASLVPGDAVLDVAAGDVAITALYHGWRRMTLTFPAINRAQRILWLVTGADKADAVAGLVRGDRALPASRINREAALLLVDRAALRA